MVSLILVMVQTPSLVVEAFSLYIPISLEMVLRMGVSSIQVMAQTLSLLRGILLTEAGFF
jgi:hypothetical protein